MIRQSACRLTTKKSINLLSPSGAPLIIPSKQINLTSPRQSASSKRQIKSISKELIKQIKGADPNRNPLQSLNTSNVLNKQSSAGKLHLQSNLVSTNHTETREYSANRSVGKGMRHIQSYKNIPTFQKRVDDLIEGSGKQSDGNRSCCPDKDGEKPSLLGKQSIGNIVVERRKIKLLTCKPTAQPTMSVFEANQQQKTPKPQSSWKGLSSVTRKQR